MFGFGNNDTKKTETTTTIPAPSQSRYARTSFKLDPSDELGTDYSRQKAIGSTFGTTDIDYILAHYAPMTMRQLDHIEMNVHEIYTKVDKALENKELEGRFADLDIRYGELYEKHNLLLKYLADEHLNKKFAYKDDTLNQR